MRLRMGLVIGVVLLLLLTLTGCNRQESRPTERAADEGPWVFERRIEIMIPVSLGGGFDNTLRAFQPYLEQELGQTIVIDARPGGSGVIGMTYSFSAPRDGYHFQGIAPTPIISAAQDMFSVPIMDHIVPVTGLLQTEGMIFANPNVPFNDLDGMLRYVRANPGRVSISLDSPTGTAGVLLTMFAEQMGIDIRWIVGGGDENRIDTISGNADLLHATWNETAAYVHSGDLIPIAILADRRNPIIPDVPAVSEIGVNLTIGFFRIFTAMSGTPQGAIDAFEAAVHRAVRHEGWQRWLLDNGISPDYVFTQEELGVVIRDTYEQTRDLLSRAR